jgi:glutathione S-transferase
MISMYRLKIANKNYSSWSLRPWLLLRMLRIEFEENLTPFGDSRFSAGAPAGLVPVLEDGETTIWDSLAIAEYLAERHVGVWANNSRLRAWSRCAAAEMHAGFHHLRNALTMNCGCRIEPVPASMALQQELDRIDELWHAGLDLGGGPFLAGESFTAVDAFFAPVALRMQTYDIVLSARSMNYAERLRNLEPMQAWYGAALLEPWRHEAHELEARAAGRLVADLRI